MPLSKSELQDIRSLNTRKGRNTHGQFLAEGVRLMEEALNNRFLPDRTYISRALLSERGLELVEKLNRVGVETVEIPARQLEQIADTTTPQGIVGLFRLPHYTLSELYPKTARRVLLCENISDPGNLGTLMRSALAFGMQAVIAVGSCAEIFSPKVVRGSAGAVFGIRSGEFEWSEVREQMLQNGATLIASELSGSVGAGKIAELCRNKSVVLAVGSEANGLSQEVLSCAGIRVRIAHSNAVESLNAAVAGSILMRELYQESE